MDATARQWKIGEVVDILAPPASVRRADLPWHLFYTGARSEVAVIKGLKDHYRFGEADVWSPHYLEWQTPRRERLSAHQRKHIGHLARLVPVRLCPRYLLVRTARGVDRWHEMFERVGIAGLTVLDRVPHQCSDVLVAKFRKLEADHGGAIPGSMPVADLYAFVLGEQVRVVDGPFASFNGTVDQLDESGRLKLLVDLLGRKCSVALEAHQVEKL